MSSPTRQDSEAPFDAATYFRDYDHDAVRELSSKTVICPATFNRKGTVEVCLGETNRHKMEAKMYIHDDGSSEYDNEWLAQFGDRVFRHKHGQGGRAGVKNLRSNITKSLLGDFEPKIFDPWLKEDFGDDEAGAIRMRESAKRQIRYAGHRRQDRRSVDLVGSDMERSDESFGAHVVQFA